MIKDSKQFAKDLPGYPRTPHLPFNPNTSSGDIVADMDEMVNLFSSPFLTIEEKIDGANCALMLGEDGDPIVRNRDHILKKGFMKDTPAKLQFRPLWNYFYDHRKSFEAINKKFGHPVGIYGEWCWALHGIIYDKLPDHLIAFDLYDPAVSRFIAPQLARAILTDAGFTCPPLVRSGPIPMAAVVATITSMRNDDSLWSSEKREGIYIKNSDGQYVMTRYKAIREGYKQGCKWSPDKLVRQLLV